MVIGTPDNSYEDEMHHALGIPMVADASKQQLPGEKYSYPPSKYEGNINSPKTSIPDLPEKIPDDWKEIGPEGIKTNSLEKPKEVHIVRHGETQANDDNTVRGQDPTPLNENGRQEAEKAADELKDKGVDTIVASDLKRSRETAEIIGKKLGITPQYDRRLRTWDVGDHTGQPCETSNPILKDYAQNKQDEPVPGGESFNDFQARSFAGIRDAVLNNKDKNLAIVTHNRVEATLKGWEKTGQNNPDIDYNEVVKEETEPGTVRTVEFQPDATILQPNTQLAENFSERFGKWGVINPGRYEVYSHPGMFQRVPGPNREPFESIPEEGKGTESIMKGTEPIMKKEISPALKIMRQSLVDHIMGLGENAVSSLHDILLHPDNLVGTGELGALIPKAGTIEAMRAAGKTVREIATELGISSYKVRDLLYGRKGDRVTPEPKGIKDEKETIKSAALRHPDTGKVYEGVSHGDALNAALNSKEYPGTSAYDIPWEDGFTTSTGRYVDREEAAKIVGVASKEGMSPASRGILERRETEKNRKLISEDVPELKAEQLKRFYRPKGKMQNPSQQQQANAGDFNTANRNVTQLQRPANENRDLQIKDPAMDAEIERSWNALRKILSKPDLKSIQGGKGQSPEMQKLLQDNPGMDLKTAQEIIDLTSK